MARRTRALFLNAHAAIQIAPAVAEIMIGELGRENAWIAEQLASFAAVAGSYLQK